MALTLRDDWGLKTGKIAKQNTAQSCYYRRTDRQVCYEASLQENRSNYCFSDAVTGLVNWLQAELLIPSFLARFLPRRPVKQPSSCHHFATLVRLQPNWRFTVCGEAAWPLDTELWGRLWLRTELQQQPPYQKKKTWIRAQQGGSAPEDRLNMPPLPKRNTIFYLLCHRWEQMCNISRSGASSSTDSAQYFSEGEQHVCCVTQHFWITPPWFIWDSFCRVGSDAGVRGTATHYCDYVRAWLNGSTLSQFVTNPAFGLTAKAD